MNIQQSFINLYDELGKDFNSNQSANAVDIKNTARPKPIGQKGIIMVKVIGYCHKKGSGNINGVEREWDNYCIDCITDTNHDYNGCSCLTLKVKTSDVSNIFGVSPDGLSTFLNQEVKLNYIPNGKYPTLDSVTLIKK